ncbi:MAG: patatin-like phospholipase family protein [Oscillospiraceae bacterium]
MKKALVLGGGGSKGAYECGAMRALRELGETFDIVTGTSIGALNGALYVQGDLESLEEMWETICPEDVMYNSEYFEGSLDAIMSNIHSLPNFLKNYVRSMGANITPFKKLLAIKVNEERFFASKQDFGLITVRFPSFSPVEIQKQDIYPGYLGKWLLATSACFPAFPIAEVDRQSYIDGGYYDNLPIATAVRLGADEIVAINLNPETTHPGYAANPKVTYIRPAESLGPFLLFERNVLDRNLVLGYNDTMKAFGRYRGIAYTFASQDWEQFKAKSSDFARLLLSVEAFDFGDARIVLNKTSDDAPYTEFLLEKIWKNKHSGFDLFVRGLEICMSKLGFSDERIYDLAEAIEDVKSKIALEMSKPGGDENAVKIGQLARLLRNGRFSRAELSSREKDEVIAAALAATVMGGQILSVD